MTERPSYLDVLEDLSAEELALHGVEVNEEYERIRKVREQINGEVLRRLARDDREMDSWGDVAVFKQQTFGQYEWDVEKLWPLLTEHLHAAQVAECVTAVDVPAHVETTVHTTAVKKYAAKLGRVGQEMLACAYRKPNAPSVKYERIEPVLQQFADSVAAILEEKGAKV